MHLQGIRIISFNHFLMGPLGIQFLADLGADVIAVEPISGAFQRHWGGADGKRAGGETTFHLVSGRNKKSICLNLKDPAAIEIARKLILTADVVTENYRPGVMDKLGLGYEALRELKSDIIYAAATGFGVDGPYVDRPGQDMIAQSLSGLAWSTGKTGDMPRLVGTAAVDHHGAMIFAAGILAALVKKLTTGKGGRVDVNLLSSALDLQAEALVCYFNGDRPESCQSTANLGSWYHEAPYGIYKTSDAHIGLSLGKLETLFDALEISEIRRLPQAEAYRRREEISRLVAETLERKPFAYWSERFEPRGIWFTQVNDYDGVAADPQVRHNGSLVEAEAWSGDPITLVAHPVRYDGQTPPIRLAPQRLGAQTAEVLGELGYREDDIRALAASGAIALDG